MKKKDVIALYRDAFLEGKDEEAIRRFDEKDLSKQYGSIMAWKRRQRLANADGNTEQSSVNSILELLKKAKKDVAALESLLPKDRERLSTAINLLKEDIDNFDRIRKARLLRQLESEQEKMNREKDNLDRKIEALRQELG